MILFIIFAIGYGIIGARVGYEALTYAITVIGFVYIMVDLYEIKKEIRGRSKDR
jgi:hypothetical protein